MKPFHGMTMSQGTNDSQGSTIFSSELLNSGMTNTSGGCNTGVTNVSYKCYIGCDEHSMFATNV